MTVPTTHELKELAAHVRQLQDAKEQARNFRNDSVEKFLEYEVTYRRWQMASDHLGDRIKDFIASGETGLVQS